ncbi:hypothetical protein [Bacillus cereus]|uniref:hypothetical protein n=1 Tax=Bacillus cereus TaxID=1396 RepID=UPI00345BB00F
MSLELEVILEKIRCISTGGDDEPFGVDALEVRGGLGASVGREQWGDGNRESHTFFRRPDDEGVRIPGGDFFAIQVGRRLIVHPNEFVWIGGRLMEDDDLSADDDFNGGHTAIPFDYNFLNTYPTVVNEGHRTGVMFSTQGQEVEAVYFLKKLRNL